MEAAVEKRLAALEERLGILASDESKSEAALDLFSLKKKLSDLGYGFIFKVDPVLIKELCYLSSNPKYAASAQKKAAIEFGYDLMMERVRQLEQFQKSAEVVLASKQLTSAGDLQPALESARKELLEAANDVNRHSEEINDLKKNFCGLVMELQQQLTEFDEIISRAERLKAGSK